MRNLYLFSIAFLMTLSCLGQNNVDIVKPPNKVLPSPQAFAITNYGNLAINESSGKFIYNLPLYTYKAGNLILPISLNYIGNGVKVNQLSTWTGINWTLNSGGVITRSVYHNPDELVAQRIFHEDIIALNLEPDDDATILYSYYQSPVHSMWDTQPDIFHFSFLNYSGSFYLDRNFNPILLNEDSDLKIEILGNQTTNKEKLSANNKFLIITPNGVKYFFGNEDIEISSKEEGAHHQINAIATTAYYLYRIEDPINGIINFEYSDYHSKIGINEFQSWSRYNLPESQSDIDKAGSFYGTGCLQRISNTSPSPARPGKVYKIIDGKYLSQISSPNTSIKINYHLNSSINGRFNFKNILSNIEVKNSVDTLYNFDFNYFYNYSDTNIAQRFFLTNVTINEDRSTKFKKFKFSYKNLSALPVRFSNSQDHLGYYNAKNNSTMFPNTNNFLFNSAFSADRNSDFDTRCSGALTKITYPTKGYTKIEYEAPLNKQLKLQNVNLETHINGFENYINNKLLDTYNIGGLFVGENGNAINVSGAFITENVNIEIEVISQTSLTLHQSELINFDIVDVTNPTNPITTHNRVVIPYPNNYVDYDGFYFLYKQSFSFEFLKNHKYTIHLHLSPNSSFTTKLGARLNFTYTKGLELKEGEGIRVKRISDFTNNLDLDAEPKNIKRYYYTKVQNIKKDPLEYVPIYKKPKYITSGELLIAMPFLCVEANQQICFTTYGHTATSLNIYPNNYSSNVTYKNITISYGGDNFENGCIEKMFYTDRDWDGDHIEDTYDNQIQNENYKDSIYNPINIFFHPYIKSIAFNNMKNQYNFSEWKSVQNGNLLSQSVYKLDAGILYKMEQINYNNSYSKTKTLNCYIGLGVNVCGLYHHKLMQFGGGVYRLYSRKINSSSQIIKKFIDPYPMVENVLGQLPDESLYKTITTEKFIDFASEFKGLATKIEMTGYLPNETLVINKKYVTDNDINSLNNLSTMEINAFLNLQSIHQINEPIQIKKVLKKGTNNKVLETKRILYKTNLYGDTVPKKIQISKGENELEDQIIFKKYDGNGYPIEISYKNGSITKYTYNNRGKITRKIENYHLVPIGSSSNSLVTSYFYNLLDQIVMIINPQNESTFYEYDVFHRLKYIKDNDGNIIKEFDNNYRRL